MKTRKLLKRAAQLTARLPLVHQEAAAFGTMAHIFHRKQLIKSLGVDLLLDVGANAGQYGSEVRNFYRGEIISFEPVTSVFEQLRERAQQDRKWTAHNVALGRESGTKVINIANSSDFSSFLCANDFGIKAFGHSATSSTAQPVEIRRLDELLPALVPDLDDRRVFLKLDTQGFDTEVFSGLGAIVNRIVAIQSEVSVIPIYRDMLHWTEALHRYEQAGFAIAGLYPVNKIAQRVIEFDCYMVNDAFVH